jgi:hypothetical protein
MTSFCTSPKHHDMHATANHQHLQLGDMLQVASHRTSSHHMVWPKLPQQSHWAVQTRRNAVPHATVVVSLILGKIAAAHLVTVTQIVDVAGCQYPVLNPHCTRQYRQTTMVKHADAEHCAKRVTASDAPTITVHALKVGGSAAATWKQGQRDVHQGESKEEVGTTEHTTSTKGTTATWSPQVSTGGSACSNIPSKRRLYYGSTQGGCTTPLVQAQPATGCCHGNCRS